jgi:LPS sulfotransferase NodH
MRITNVRPFDGPEFDTPPGSEATRALTYVVCSTPRSGSGLLCRTMAATRVAGTPIEYFDLTRRALLSRRWGCGPALAAYTEALWARRTSPSGVFATKLHWYHVDALLAEKHGRRRGEAPFEQPASFVEELLGGRPVYVRILRRDVNRQAVSLWTAERTGVWGMRSGGRRGLVRYSFAGIKRARARIVLGELHWERFFRFNGIEPIEVVYEDLSADYESTVAGVLERLVPGAGTPIPPPLTTRQADERTERFLARFLHDLGRHHTHSVRDRIRPRMRVMLPWR